MKVDERHYLKLPQFAVEFAVGVDLLVVFLGIIWTCPCKVLD